MKNSTLEWANEFLMPNYGDLSVEIVSGQGAYVWIRDENGKKKKCLDLLCGLGVTSLGHCHPAVVAAIIKQVQTLMHVSNLYATKPMAQLAELLARKTGYGYKRANVFFCNSGTEANEAAGKLARIWAHEKYGPHKNRIIALTNSFHGRTFLSISLTGQEKMQKMFSPIVPAIQFVPLNDVRALNDEIDDDVCAVIFEVIQAEGGVNLMTLEFYKAIKQLAKKHQFLRIVDEVQTGMGRTGDFFSFRHFEGYGDGPEIITMAKALGGGLSIGATIARKEIGKYLLPGSHAATFGGNPVACAAALASLKVIEKQKLLAKVDSLGAYFMSGLQALAACNPKIKEVRGRGLMIGVELQPEYQASQVVTAMRKKGVLIGTAGPQVVRFLPPFIVTQQELYQTLYKFSQVLKKL